MGTSYYTENMDIDNASVEEVATFIQSELQNGIHQNKTYYPGLIGEIECSYPLTLSDRRHLQATACQDPKIPISIHPGRSIEAPFEAVRILLESGANERKVSMCHLDRTLLTNKHLAKFADEFKCFLQFELFEIENSFYQTAPVFMPNDGQRLKFIKFLVESENCTERSNDIWRKNRLLAYGGQGYGHLLRTVTPMAREVVKLSETEWNTITWDNPKKWLTWE